MGAIVAVGDIHFPYHSVDALTAAYGLIDRIHQDKGVDLLIQVGDAYDMMSFSRHVKSLNHFTPKEELKEAREAFLTFWQTVRKLTSKKTQFVQLLGNHETRLARVVLEKAPELEGLLNTDYLFKAPSVETVLDDRQEFYYRDIVFTHGYRSKLGDHAKYMLHNVVCGHSHRGGVHFEKIYDFYSKAQNKEKLIWELNAGYLGDPSFMGNYSKQKFSKWTWGLGVIDENGPRFCPF